MTKLTEMQIMKIVGEFEKAAGEEHDRFIQPLTAKDMEEELKYNLMHDLENELQELFNNSPRNVLHRYYAFVFENQHYKIQLTKQPGYPFYTCHVVKVLSKWDQDGEKELLSEFIFKNCNPEGALIIERLMFRDIV